MFFITSYFGNASQEILFPHCLNAISNRTDVLLLCSHEVRQRPSHPLVIEYEIPPREYCLTFPRPSPYDYDE